jgi:hypothetical protein
MKFRAFTLGAVVAAAATGLIPSAAMASGTPTMTTGGAASAGSGSSSSSSSSSNDKTNVNVSVVAQLPDGLDWHDKMLYDHGKQYDLPSGYSYKDGGVLGPDDRFYFAPSGEHQGVVIAPMQCKGGKYDYNSVSSGNWIGKIVDSALKACAGVYDAAYSLVSTAFGGSSDSGYGSGSC